MITVLCMLHFPGAVRFGEHAQRAGLDETTYACHSDTLFAAMAHEAARLDGALGATKLEQEATQYGLRVSSLFPFKSEELFLPKPVWLAQQVSTAPLPADRKRLKKLQHYPVTRWNACVGGIQAGRGLPNDVDPDSDIYRWGEKQRVTQISLRGEGRSESGDPLPYQVTTWRFYPDTGLYFIMKCRETWLDAEGMRLLRLLSLTGIGGKTSLGKGRFELTILRESDAGLSVVQSQLFELLNAKADRYMALSTVLASAEELDGTTLRDAEYSLIMRDGFTNSPSLGQMPGKHLPVAMFAPGSCFAQPLLGRIADVGQTMPHPVYRYGMGLYLPLTGRD